MQFLISVIDDGHADVAGRAESGTDTEAVAIDAFNEELQAAGQWVFAGGLGFPRAATTIDNRAGAAVVTDGPFVESKEFIAGFWIVEATDLATARDLALRGSEACNRRVELRPFLAPSA
jgi:hypothetical protein